MSEKVETTTTGASAEKPVETTPAASTQEASTELKSGDILKRVQQAKPTETTTPSPDTFGLQMPALESIKDPEARKFIEQEYKNMQSGLTKKFQELSELRKSVESEKNKLSTWTPERLDEVLKDQSFMSLVQQRVSMSQGQDIPESFKGSADEWGGLSDEQKRWFGDVESKLNSVTQYQEKLEKQQTDERIKTRMPLYDSTQVNSFEEQLVGGKVSMEQRRELISKALNFESAIENAYKLGLQDRATDVSKRQNASSLTNGITGTETAEEIKKPAGMSSANYFKTIALRNLQKLSQK